MPLDYPAGQVLLELKGPGAVLSQRIPPAPAATR
jgi:hypothetical protein